jgi:hypothetical protein
MLNTVTDLQSQLPAQLDVLKSDLEGNLKCEVRQLHILIEESETRFKSNFIALDDKFNLQSHQISTLETSSHTQLSDIRTELVSLVTTKIEEVGSLHSTQIQSIQNEIDRLKTVAERPFPVIPPEPNLDILELRPDVEVDLDLPPVLPQLKKFTRLSQSVEYLYELIPVLQAILRAFYTHVNGITTRTSNWTDLRSEVVSLQSVIQGLATREELSLLMKRKAAVKEPDSRGSGFGLVKCISCGRELPTTTDFTEESLAHHRGPPSAGRMTIGIVESPTHSARGFRRPQVRRKIQTPL